MPFKNNQKNKNGQGDIKNNPEEGAKRPPNTLQREVVMDIAGRKRVISTESHIERDGRPVKQTISNYELAPDGRWLRPDEFIAWSWTGLAIPRDRFGTCINPFGLHPYRNVYLELDGIITEIGNVLCTECLERQEKKLTLSNWLLFGLLYKPRIF